jgi:hypothetical protein
VIIWCKYYFEKSTGEKVMARHQVLEDNIVVSARIEKSMYQMLQDIAALESINTGRKVTVQELLRNALNYVYSDNERLRESFRKSRSHITKRIK